MNTMNEDRNTEPVAAWIGLDWADQKHLIAEYNVATDRVERYELKHSAEAIQQWIAELRGRYGSSRVAVVLEQSRGSVLYALMSWDFLVLYPINPLALANYRKAFYTSRAKSDPGDADLMCEMVRKHPDRFRSWSPDDSETRSLQLLVEARRKLVNEITRLTNRLKAGLKQYFPQALEFAGELDTRQACDFLEQWPTLVALQQARPSRLQKFYLSYGRPRREVLEERIKRIKGARPLTEDPAVVLAGSMSARILVAQIRVLIEGVEDYEDRINQLFQQHPDRFIFEGLPGAGSALAPRLLAAFGSDRDRLQSAADIQQLSGIAPVTEQSGNSRWVHCRFGCPKFLRQSFHEYARQSILQSNWAKAYYDQLRESGKGHHSAVRALAFKWIRIMFRCWKTRTAYNEAVYMNSLKLRNPNLFARALRVQTERQTAKTRTAA